MKTLSYSKSNLRFTLIALFISASQMLFAQNAELVFKNGSLLSGNALNLGAKYLYKNVTAGVDAVLTIASRSDNNVVITSLDMTNTGFDKAFQPQVGRTGTASANTNWWLEFQISFYQSGHTTPPYLMSMANINATSIDNDGDGNSLREFVQVNEITSYTTAVNTSLQTSLLTVLPFNVLTGSTEYNYKFLGSLQGYNNIDTAAIAVMSTYVYKNKSSITFRFGGQTGNSSVNNPSRMYSIWFKQFALSPLPVKLTSFSASLNLNNKVDLRWSTINEVNLSYYMVEKSTDGRNFTDAGMAFAAGSATETTNYILADNLGANPPAVIYYRLRSVDVDGKSQYSETRIIRTGKSAVNAVTILTYPNPASSEIRITVPASWQNKKVVYEIYNAGGQVLSKSVVAASSQTEIMNISKLATGFYLVKASCEGEIAQQKIVKN